MEFYCAREIMYEVNTEKHGSSMWTDAEWRKQSREKNVQNNYKNISGKIITSPIKVNVTKLRSSLTGMKRGDNHNLSWKWESPQVLQITHVMGLFPTYQSFEKQWICFSLLKILHKNTRAVRERKGNAEDNYNDVMKQKTSIKTWKKKNNAYVWFKDDRYINHTISPHHHLDQLTN